MTTPAMQTFADMNAWWLLELRARTSPDVPFLTWQPFDDEPRVWTYAELARDAAALGAGLAARGVRAGDPVLIHLENCPEFLISWFACAAIGAVAVTTNTRSARDELEYFAGHCRPVGAITQPSLVDLVSASAPDLGWVASTGDDSFRSLSGDPGDLVAAPRDPSAPMSVQYTSGTTSRPKGVLWTHANALWGARVNASHEDLHPGDCHLVYMPLFHANAMVYSMLPSMWVGGRIVLVPKWSTSRFWDISVRHRCTWLSLIGPGIHTLLTTEAPSDHTYRLFGTGVCDIPLLPGVKTIGWWGMTETISHPVVGDPFVPNRPMTMGRPAPEYEVAVVREDLTPVDPEETGELLVRGIRGLSLFAEYLHDPEATRAGFTPDGWFRTGDLVTPHADGHITFADRAKDMLKVGAENVAASEIERVVASVPGIHEAAVVGRKDARLDEVPVVFVVADPARTDLPDLVTSRCREMLADFKVPRDVFVVRELPRSTLRKVNKAALRAVATPEADRETAEKQWVVDAASDPSGDSA